MSSTSCLCLCATLNRLSRLDVSLWCCNIKHVNALEVAEIDRDVYQFMFQVGIFYMEQVDKFAACLLCAILNRFDTFVVLKIGQKMQSSLCLCLIVACVTVWTAFMRLFLMCNIRHRCVCGGWNWAKYYVGHGRDLNLAYLYVHISIFSEYD